MYTMDSETNMAEIMNFKRPFLSHLDNLMMFIHES